VADPVARLRPGANLETVELSGMYHGVVRTWRGDGKGETRRLGDGGNQVWEAIARGVLARSSAGAGRFREVAMLDAADNVMAFMGRTKLKAGATSVNAPAQVVEAPETDTPGPLDIPAWTEWGRWLSSVVVAAAARGEYVVAERGGRQSGGAPFAVMALMHRPEGWVDAVEANPAPSFDPWPKPNPDGSATLSAPATAQNVGVAGLLAVQAISLWAATPLDVVLTFCVSPDGPWSA